MSKRIVDISIWIITYNHELYIANAIRSVLNQKIKYNYEIIISDDCSADKTLEICQEFQAKYPDIIKVFSSEKNIGYEKNFFNNFKRCNGQFVAMLEGDDFWTDKREIEEDIMFLKNNNEYSGVCSNFNTLDGGIKKPYYISKPWGKDVFTIEDLLKVWTIHINTLVFRNEMLDLNLVDGEVICADIALAIILAYKGPIKYNDKITATWRLHEKGFSNKLNANHFKILNNKKKYLNHFNKKFKYKFEKNIRYQLHWDYSQWQNNLKRNLSFKNFLFLILSSFYKMKYSMPKKFKHKLIHMFPKTYKLNIKLRKYW